MKIFKERLIELTVSVAVAGVVVGFLWGVIALLKLIYSPLPEILLCLGILAFLIYLVAKFIYWLLIEPFRKGKAK